MFDTRKHLFHLLNVSPWPLFTSIGAFFLTSGFTFYLHNIYYGNQIFFLGIFILTWTISNWFYDIIDESTFVGDHSIAVQMGLTSGFILFLISEVMLFFGFFWSFFHSSLSPSILLGAEYPPIGITIIPVYLFPLMNTCLLLLSGITVTWLHKAILLGNYKESIDSFFLTIFLGLCFFTLQIFEYYESPFSYNNSVYSSVFFMLTGLHGFHVFVGIVSLIVSFIRLLWNQLSVNRHIGLTYSIWYWHFVDIIWVFLYITLYLWSSI